MTTPSIPVFQDSFSESTVLRARMPSALVKAVAARVWAPARALAGSVAAKLSTRPVFSLCLAYWLTIYAVDFINDWLLAGIARPLRPWFDVARDVTIWWTTWLPFTPVIVWLAKRWSYEQRGLAANVSRHLAVSLLAVFLHLVFAAATFFFLYPVGPSISERVAHWLGGFTLTEFLVYWGLVILTWVFVVGRDRVPHTRHSTRTVAGHFTVRESDRIRLIPVRDVDWLEAEGNYIRLHVGDQRYLVRGSLRSALERLDMNQFVRIHRSTVVNVHRVREIQPWFSGDYLATLENGQQLRISRTYRDALLAPMI